MSRAKPLWIALSLTSIAAGAVGLWVAAGNEEAASRDLVDRLWIARMPSDDRDVVGKLVLVRTEHGPYGVVGRSSVWRHAFEVFRFAVEGNRLLAFFPQERVRAAFEVRTWRCAGEAPAPFELCAELRHGKHTAKLFSMEEWVVRPETAAADLRRVGAEHPQLGELPEIDAVRALPPAEAVQAWSAADDAFALPLDPVPGE
jgi:hypothetical protein